MATDTDTIDALLERYLSLLDEYTTLRTKLGQLQTGMFQHLARANFSAERGMRYGPDYYDERMQTTRQVEISFEDNVPVFRVAASDELSSDDASEGPPANADAEAEVGPEKPDEGVSASGGKAGKGERTKKPRSKDPLRWFGVLTPLALRQTQACAVEGVEQVIPRLVSVNAAMQDVEIQVRRARKKRAKAKAAAAKERDLGQHQRGVAREEVAT